MEKIQNQLLLELLTVIHQFDGKIEQLHTQRGVGIEYVCEQLEEIRAYYQTLYEQVLNMQ